jgi:DNA-binding MarR family transcriptional regulator
MTKSKIKRIPKILREHPNVGLFLNEKIVELYFMINISNLYECSMKIHMTYAHAHKVARNWEKMGLVIITKNRRILNMSYTPKGQRVLDMLLAARTILRNEGIQFKNEVGRGRW